MAHIVRYEVFERPSHPQDGPLHTIALDLPRDQFQTEFWPAIQQQAESIRSFESLPKDKFERTDFPQQTPTYTVPAGLYNAEDIPAITQLSDSYRLRSSLPLDKFQRTDFAHAPPQWTIPLDLPRDLFQTEFWPALEQSLRSFRSKGAPRLQSEFHTQPAFSWLDGALDLEEAQQFMAAARQLTDSFRSKAAPVLDPHWTDFPQGTPLLTIPLDLPRDQFSTEFWPSIEQSLRSFRSNEGSRLQSEFHTQPASSGWIAFAGNHLEVDPARQPALSQQTNSFRTRESLPVDKFERTDFPDPASLYKVPEDLLGAIEFYPAWHSQSQSFRTDPEPKLDSRYYTQPVFSWLDQPLDLQEPDLFMVGVRQLTESFRTKPGQTLDPRPEWVQPAWIAAAGNHLEVRVEFTPACSQQIWSFRSDERAKLVPQFYTQPEFSWIDGVLDLEEAQNFMVAVGQLTNSFRVPDHAKLIPQFYTQPAFSWLSLPLNLFDPQDGVASCNQLAGSFRTRESLPVDKFERTDFPQGTPLLTIPLDLPRDLFETQFIPAIYQQAGSFRSLKEELLTGQHLTQPQPVGIFSTIVVVPAFTDENWPAVEQLIRSFRVRESLPVDKFERTDFPQYSPLLTIPADLPRDRFAAEDWPAIEQSLRSFRTKKRPSFFSALFEIPANNFSVAIVAAGSPSIILLPKTRNFIIDAKGPNPIILSTGRPSSVKDS